MKLIIITFNIIIIYHQPFKLSEIFKTTLICSFQYDCDNDGMREVLLATADGSVIFLESDGTVIEGEMLLVCHATDKNNVSFVVVF